MWADGIDVGISAINTPHFLAKPGAPAKVMLNTPLAPVVASLQPLPIAPGVCVGARLCMRVCVYVCTCVCVCVRVCTRVRACQYSLS